MEVRWVIAVYLVSIAHLVRTIVDIYDHVRPSRRAGIEWDWSSTAGLRSHSIGRTVRPIARGRVAVGCAADDVVVNYAVGEALA